MLIQAKTRDGGMRFCSRDRDARRRSIHSQLFQCFPRLLHAHIGTVPRKGEGRGERERVAAELWGNDGRQRVSRSSFRLASSRRS